MEGSLGSFVDKGFGPQGEGEGEGEDGGGEESGWTAYFQDLSSLSRGGDVSNPSGCCATSSLVSDAAWKPTTAACSSMVGSPQIPRKLSFKKTRAREISYDDSLEDTASSPVNSPKTSILQKTDHHHMEDPHQGKVDGGGDDHYSRLQQNGRNVGIKDFNGNNIDQCTDLKKRGLCLVPLSMVVDHRSGSNSARNNYMATNYSSPLQYPYQPSDQGCTEVGAFGAGAMSDELWEY